MRYPRKGKYGPYKKKTVPNGPLPVQVSYMAQALEVIDTTETRTGFVPMFHICEQTGVSEGTMRGLLIGMRKLGIIEGRRSCLGGYKRLRKATIQELCGILGPRYDIPDPRAHGKYLAEFHHWLKMKIEGHRI